MKNGTAEIIFVHGSYHGPWCWDLVRRWLGARGIGSSAVDLVAATDASTVGLARHVVSHAGRGRAILVGHSSGGHVISAAAEEAAQPLLGLVYVSGTLHGEGRSANESPREAAEQPVRPEEQGVERHDDLPGRLPLRRGAVRDRSGPHPRD